MMSMVIVLRLIFNQPNSVALEEKNYLTRSQLTGDP